MWCRSEYPVLFVPSLSSPGDDSSPVPAAAVLVPSLRMNPATPVPAPVPAPVQINQVEDDWLKDSDNLTLRNGFCY